MKLGSLFTGAGGFDLGLEQSGMKVVWQCEINKQCQSLLKRHWPDDKRFEDITMMEDNNYGSVDIICGGDPCPCRSKAKENKKSRHPDLSGYFLAVVGRLRSRWILRENVLASDDIHFSTCLELLGYRTIIIRINAYAFTGQNRTRDFIIGCNHERYERELFINECLKRNDPKRIKQAEGYPCLTTQEYRGDPRDGYIFDGSGVRVASACERTKLAGFPENWFEGFSKTAVARMTGNAVVVPVAKYLGDIIIKIDGGLK